METLAEVLNKKNKDESDVVLIVTVGIAAAKRGYDRATPWEEIEKLAQQVRAA